MSKLNPEAEANKTVASFRDAAEKHRTVEQVWAEMSQDSKAFGHGSDADKKYFHAVTEGLKKQGLLPEITVAYAQWHKNDMASDDGDLGRFRIDGWSDMRKLQNGRVCEVEQALISNLKESYDSMLKTGHAKVGDYGNKNLTSQDLVAVNAEFSKTRHTNESDAATEVVVQRDAVSIKHKLFDPRKDDGSVLFDKLSQSNGGKYISIDSIEAAEKFDSQQRELQYHHQKGWHSYLDGQDKKAIVQIEQQYWDNIAPLVQHGRGGAVHADRITREDLNRYLAEHGAEKK